MKQTFITCGRVKHLNEVEGDNTIELTESRERSINIPFDHLENSSISQFFWMIFRKCPKFWLFLVVSKKFKLLEYGHVTYQLKSCAGGGRGALPYEFIWDVPFSGHHFSAKRVSFFSLNS